MLWGNAQEREPEWGSRLALNVGCANYIVKFYGIHSLLADIDRGREFWRDGDHFVSTILDWICESGFTEFFEQYDIHYSSAQDFRHRHIVNQLKSSRF